MKRNTKATRLKDIELKIVSELMKNSRRSDRGIAKALGVSQPTVTRTRIRLEKEGYIQEYTAVPNFRKIGYQILALTFFKLPKTLTNETLEKARETAKQAMNDGPCQIIMLERGIGLNFDGFAISYHRDYSDHLDLIKWFRQFEFMQPADIQSFIVDLNDVHKYKPLTFSTIAKHLLTLDKEKNDLPNAQ